MNRKAHEPAGASIVIVYRLFFKTSSIAHLYISLHDTLCLLLIDLNPLFTTLKHTKILESVHLTTYITGIFVFTPYTIKSVSSVVAISNFGHRAQNPYGV